MGYLIAGHFTKQRPESSKVRVALPPSIGFTLYEHRTYPIFAIDTYRASKPSRYAFSAATPATDVSLELAPELTVLYEKLRTTNAANGFKRSYLNLSRALSQSLREEVLTIYTDDDGNDFACLTRGGEVLSGVARCEAYIVQFGPADGSTRLFSDEPRLHHLAWDAMTSFTGVPASEIGFGTFDPPENLGFKVTDA